MTVANANPFAAQIESIRSGLSGAASDDFRVFAEGMVNWVSSINPNLPTVGGTKANSQAVPKGVSLKVTGSNGSFAITIANGSQNGRTVWHEISYSTLKSFTRDVTILPITSATSLTISDPGASYFFRWRSSFDQVNWSAYELATSATVSAGLVSSSATASAVALNQTNYGVVTSKASTSAGSGKRSATATAVVEISGAAGAFTSLVAVKGAKKIVLPSATISGVAPGSKQFVGWNGQHYVLRPTLAALLDDNLTPIGACSVVSTATPTLPTIHPIVVGGGIVGYNVTDGGAGASQAYDLTITGAGTGATAGAQTITAGVLVSVAPGNPGSGYGSGTAVAASGGTGGGTSGGGTAAGGNGGRLTAI